MENRVKYAVVDRVEGSVAVIVFDDGTRISVPDTGFSEGDVVIREDDQLFRIDREETLRRREQMEQRRRRLFKRRKPD